MRFLQKPLFYRILIISSCVVSLFTSCNKLSKHAIAENADFLNASWITDSREWPVADSLMYGEFPAPLFRKEFNVKKEVKSVTLYITAAGYYSASVNGEKIGENYLDPAWTNYRKRIYYAEYDITSQTREGINCIGATLGNGFYNLLPMSMWGRRNLRDVLPVGKPVFIARLKIEYRDGKTEEVITDKSWKQAFGPVLKNNVYLGEVYDAGREITGWNTAGFDDSKWEKSVENAGPGGRLEKAFFPPVQITAKIPPVSIMTPANGIFIMDFGVNFTGLYRIRLKGQPGDTITFRFAERLYEDGTLNPMTSVCGQIKGKGIGGPGSPDIAWQTDSYIFGNNTDIWYSPLFTFHVFRYMEISGLKYKPELADLEGFAFNSNVENNNSFTCSSPLLNSIQQASRRTFLDNLISVQSDCPGREKFGYGGDLNATSESFIYNFDMQTFYRKTIYDWVDAMQDSIFIDAVPYVGINYCGLSWESAFLITQYKLLLYYNDVELIKALYETDLKWMEKVARIHPSGMVDKGLSDHESMVKVPVKLIGTTHYLECARIMKRFAAIMNDRVNEEKFDKLANQLKDYVQEEFWKKPVTDTINRQTQFSTLLYYDIIPGEEKQAATDSLFDAIKRGPSGHFTTGIFGTKYILEALSVTGNANSVFEIVNSTAYPGWGFMIDRGATTIWETWKESDNIYSNCHPMFGTVSEWFFRWLAGIRPDPEFPGFKKFVIAPVLPGGLDYVKCTYQSPFGEITSNWERKGLNRMEFEIAVPEGTIATIILPLKDHQKIAIKEKKTGNAFLPDQNRKQVNEFELKPGEYVISAMPGK